jgi:hypothetical protein
VLVICPRKQAGAPRRNRTSNLLISGGVPGPLWGQIRISKFEIRDKPQCLKTKTQVLQAIGSIATHAEWLPTRRRVGAAWSIGIWSLFRVSCFGFRVSRSRLVRRGGIEPPTF